MTHKEAIAKLQEAIRIGDSDPEVAHGTADYAITEFLRWLGYDDVVDLWEEIPKWYA